MRAFAFTLLGAIVAVMGIVLFKCLAKRLPEPKHCHRTRIIILKDGQMGHTFIDTTFYYAPGDSICVSKTISNGTVMDNSTWEFSPTKPEDATDIFGSDRLETRIAVVDSVENEIVLN